MSDMYAKFNKEVTDFGNLFKKSKTKSAQSLKPKIKSVQSEPLKKGDHYSKPPSRQIKSEPLRSRSETAPHLRKKEEKKLKWTQIIILVLILTAVAVIIYFIVDGFKKKCPDPNRPVYSKEYLDCIPRCDPVSEIYDRNVDDCILREICSEDPERHIPYPIDDPDSYCSGQRQYCVCGPPCPQYEYFNPDILDCDCPTERCPDGRCCGDLECIPDVNNNYFCCDPEQVYYDDYWNPVGCCGPYTKPDSSKTGCLAQCGPITKKGITNYNNWRKKSKRNGNGDVCENGMICSVVVFTFQDDADLFINEIDEDLYRGRDEIEGKYYVYYCYIKGNCEWNQGTVDLLPYGKLPQIPLLYTSKIDQEGEFSLDKFSQLPPENSPEFNDFYTDFYDASPLGYGNFCASTSEQELDEYRRMKRLKGTNCDVTDCLDQVGKFTGTIRVRSEKLVNDEYDIMCSAIYGPNNNQTDIATGIICNDKGDPKGYGCEYAGQFIYDVKEDDEEEEEDPFLPRANYEFKICEDPAGAGCPLPPDDDTYSCTNFGSIIKYVDIGFGRNTFEEKLEQSNIYDPNSEYPIMKVNNVDFLIRDIETTKEEYYKLILSIPGLCPEDEICDDISNYIPTYKMYRRGKVSYGPVNTIKKTGTSNCNGNYGCKMYATKEGGDYKITYFNFGTFKLRLERTPFTGNMQDSKIQTIIEELSVALQEEDDPSNSYNYINNRSVGATANRYSTVGKDKIVLDENELNIETNPQGNVTYMSLVNLIFYYVNSLHYSGDVMASRSWAFREGNSDGGPKESGGWGQTKYMSHTGTNPGGTAEVWKTNIATPREPNTKDQGPGASPIFFEETGKQLGYSPQQYNTALLINIINKKYDIKITNNLYQAIYASYYVEGTLDLLEDYLSDNIVGNEKYGEIKYFTKGGEGLHRFLKYTRYNDYSTLCATKSGKLGYSSFMLIPYANGEPYPNDHYSRGIEIGDKDSDSKNKLYAVTNSWGSGQFVYRDPHNGEDGRTGKLTLLEFELLLPPCPIEGDWQLIPNDDNWLIQSMCNDEYLTGNRGNWPGVVGVYTDTMEKIIEGNIPHIWRIINEDGSNNIPENGDSVTIELITGTRQYLTGCRGAGNKFVIMDTENTEKVIWTVGIEEGNVYRFLCDDKYLAACQYFEYQDGNDIYPQNVLTKLIVDCT